MGSVTVVGEPAPQGSMKCVGRNGRHQLVPNNVAVLKPWRRLVRAAGEALRQRNSAPTLEGAVGVEVTITLERPKTVKPSERRWPTKQSEHHGDVDKLGRAVLDGLAEAATYLNDAQVCELHIRKVYPDTLTALTEPEPWSWSTSPLPQPGASIVVRSIE